MVIQLAWNSEWIEKTLGKAMRQTETPIHILVVDADRALQRDLAAQTFRGAEVAFGPAPTAGCDVVVINVEEPAGLAMVATHCARPNAAPVIAIARAGHCGKPLEHILLLAELRGAARALPKPIAVDELVEQAMNLASAAIGARQERVRLSIV